MTHKTMNPTFAAALCIASPLALAWLALALSTSARRQRLDTTRRAYGPPKATRAQSLPRPTDIIHRDLHDFRNL